MAVDMKVDKKKRSRIPFIGEGCWQGVEKKVYKSDSSDFKNIHRKVLLGKETPSTPIELRYFEIDPGGYSSLEKHEHTHTVIICRGEGKAIVGEEVLDAKSGDVFFVAPHESHQFIQQGEEPLGFYCIVNKDRDRPRLLSEEEKERLKNHVNFID